MTPNIKYSPVHPSSVVRALVLEILVGGSERPAFVRARKTGALRRLGGTMDCTVPGERRASAVSLGYAATATSSLWHWRRFVGLAIGLLSSAAEFGESK
jgi:hypothetical protein